MRCEFAAPKTASENRLAHRFRAITLFNRSPSTRYRRRPPRPRTRRARSCADLDLEALGGDLIEQFPGLGSPMTIAATFNSL
jgi:hypothetical protein